MPMNEEVRKAVDIDYAPGELDRTAPERVWLQIDTDGDNDQRDEQWCGPDGITWQDESIGGLEIQYIRADLLRAELARLTEIAEGVDPLVVRLGEVTTKLEAADALLRAALPEVFSNVGYMALHDVKDGSMESSAAVAKRIDAHLSEPRT